MNAGLVKSTDNVLTPWRMQPNETLEDWIAFIWWCLADGELNEELAANFKWSERRKVIETFETLHSIRPEDMGAEAALSRVQITFVEIMKLRQKSFESPDQVIDTGEIMKSIEWMINASAGLDARRSSRLDWSKCTPEERECLLQAKGIMDRMMGG